MLNHKTIHMKKIIASMLIISAFMSSSFTQSLNTKKSSDYKYFYQVPDKIETDAVSITFEDIVSKMEFCKFKIVFTNKTSDYLLVKASEIVVNINGKDYKSIERDLAVQPYSKGFRVIEVKGTDMQYDQIRFIYTCDG